MSARGGDRDVFDVSTEISKYSLCFLLQSREDGFLQANADALRTTARSSAILLISFLTIIGGAYALLSPSHVNTQTPGYSALIVQRCILAWWFLWCCCCIVCSSVPSIYARVSLPAREVIISGTLCALHVSISFSKEYYMGRICGVEDPFWFWSQSHFSDSWILLMHCAAISINQQMLPLRWCVLWPSKLSAAVSYSVNVWVLGSPESYAALLWVLFIGFLFSQSIGKRRSERTERLLFSSLVAERTKRAETEFRAHELRVRSSDEQSGSTARSSDAMFSGALNTIQKLGNSEHWMIESWQLRFDKEHPLGQGTFGVVCAGSFCGAAVALKIASQNGFTASLNELRVLRQLRHQNIVSFYGACMNAQHDDVVLVLERAYGEVLKTFVQRGGFTKADPSIAGRESGDFRRCEVLTCICSALTYLHTRKPHGLVHADLKDTNIMVECQPGHLKAKLLDFGLSRVLSSRAKPLGGTIRWMAPEVILKAPPSTAADVFSFGRLVFYVWTEQKPPEIMNKHILRALAHIGLLPKLVWQSPCQSTPTMQIWRAIYEECVRYRAEERITMNAVLIRISPLTDDGEQPLGQKFWSDVAQIRHLGSLYVHQRENKAPNVVCEMKPEIAATVPNAASSDGNRYKRKLLYPSFQKTEFSSAMALVLEALLRVNFFPTKPYCCRFHSLVELVHAIEKSICENPCMADLENVNVQCIRCGILGCASSTENEDDFCAVCENRMRPPKPSASVSL